MRVRAHPVHVNVEGLLRGEVVPLKQRPLLLKERVAGADRRCQLELVIGVLLRNDACQWQDLQHEIAPSASVAHPDTGYFYRGASYREMKQKAARAAH